MQGQEQDKKRDIYNCIGVVRKISRRVMLTHQVLGVADFLQQYPATGERLPQFMQRRTNDMQTHNYITYVASERRRQASAVPYQLMLPYSKAFWHF